MCKYMWFSLNVLYTPQFVSSQASVAMEPVQKKDEASEDADDLVRGVTYLIDRY